MEKKKLKVRNGIGELEIHTEFTQNSTTHTCLTNTMRSLNTDLSSTLYSLGVDRDRFSCIYLRNKRDDRNWREKLGRNFMNFGGRREKKGEKTDGSIYCIIHLINTYKIGRNGKRGGLGRNKLVTKIV